MVLLRPSGLVEVMGNKLRLIMNFFVFGPVFHPPIGTTISLSYANALLVVLLRLSLRQIAEVLIMFTKADFTLRYIKTNRTFTSE